MQTSKITFVKFRRVIAGIFAPREALPMTSNLGLGGTHNFGDRSIGIIYAIMNHLHLHYQPASRVCHCVLCECILRISVAGLCKYQYQQIVHVCVFVKEYAAKQEQRAKRFGEASVNQSIVNAETLNNLYDGQVLSFMLERTIHTADLSSLN